MKKFFNDDTVEDLLRMTVSVYMQLSSESLDLWKTDPEELILAEMSDAYQDKYGRV